MLRFYFKNVGRRCGWLECSRRGWLPIVIREGGSFDLWISCGGRHGEAL